MYADTQLFYSFQVNPSSGQVEGDPLISSDSAVGFKYQVNVIHFLFNGY